jgi:hypothetical protein
VVSNALNSLKYQLVTKTKQSDYELSLDFRECILGEVVKNNKCSRCIKGTYSYDPLATSCEKCFPFVNCEGGADIMVEPGYWRKEKFSTVVFKCPLSSACKGGRDSECETGYSGLLCNICGQDEYGEIYGRTGVSMC